MERSKYAANGLTLDAGTTLEVNMNRRNFLRIAGVGIAAVALPSWIRAADTAAGAAKKPNFLLIVADDMGFSDVGCYGGEIRTPNLDRLAANGLRFTSFYNTGRCWPSRGSILTGYFAQQIRRDSFGGTLGGTIGKRPAWAPLLPNFLKPLGYQSYHSGKWHVDGNPVKEGFDRSFEYGDSDHHFIPARVMAKMEKPLQPVKEEGYYSATAIADNAIRQLREHGEKYSDKPFFSYVAFIEPHWALQAPEEDINRYRDAYLKGWDQMRDERWKRMKEKGIINCELSKLEPDAFPGYNMPADKLKKDIGPGEAGRAVPWNTLMEEQKRFQATKMAIHAAMIDRMDQEIGRILDQVRAMNAHDKTVVMFVSDNGASAEQMIRGSGHDKSVPPGSAKSFLCLGPGFSSAANTPFRLHKAWVHEGGISTPLIVQWPEGIKAHGELRHDVGHLVDIVPTLVQLAGGTLPGKWADVPVPRKPGVSLVPAFAGDGSVKHDYLWWWHEDNRAIRVGDWKAVSKGKNGPWELYDMKSDRCESVNLAEKNPDKARELTDRWTQFEKEFEKLATSDGSSIFKNGKKQNADKD